MPITLEQKLPIKFSLTDMELSNKKVDCLVLGVAQASKFDFSGVKLSKASLNFIMNHINLAHFEGKLGQTLMLFQVPGITTARILLVGSGKADELNEANFKSLFSHTIKALSSHKIQSVLCNLNQLKIINREMNWALRFSIEAMCNEVYEFSYFKNNPQKHKLKEVQFVVSAKDKPKLAQTLDESKVIAETLQFVKDLGNMPANICTPSFMAKQALSTKSLSKKVKVEIFDREKLQEIGANAILAVAQGSSEPCQFIVMHYKGGKKNEAPTVLIGKGVCFDSGGLCIKGRDGMNLMKMDMCGAATVMGVFTAAVKLELAVNLIAVMPCVENMPDGKAYRPGDIIKSLSGKTIEVLDTDAEGRLILCDALTYCERFKPEVVIDVATLTGAIIVALGQHFTGLFSNNDQLVKSLIDAGKQSNDQAWHMPISDEFQKQIDSKIADVANIGGPYGGSVTAACFLARFAEKFTWAHLDIAGTSMSKDGAKGRPVSLLLQFLLNKTY